MSYPLKNKLASVLSRRLLALVLLISLLAPSHVQAFWGFDDAPEAVNALPVAAYRPYKVEVTAYTSSVEECDADPFVTADGSTTRDGIIATNFLPFNTKVRIPEVFGDRVFEVHDRMNARYWHRIDIWMEKKSDMRQFGIKRNITLEIVEMGDGKTQWAARAVALQAAR